MAACFAHTLLLTCACKMCIPSYLSFYVPSPPPSLPPPHTHTRKVVWFLMLISFVYSTWRFRAILIVILFYYSLLYMYLYHPVSHYSYIQRPIWICPTITTSDGFCDILGNGIVPLRGQCATAQARIHFLIQAGLHLGSFPSKFWFNL